MHHCEIPGQVIAAGGVTVAGLATLIWTAASEAFGWAVSIADYEGISERSIYISIIVILFTALSVIARWLAITWLREQREMHLKNNAAIEAMHRIMHENTASTNKLTDQIQRQCEWFDTVAKSKIIGK